MKQLLPLMSHIFFEHWQQRRLGKMGAKCRKLCLVEIADFNHSCNWSQAHRRKSRERMLRSTVVKFLRLMNLQSLRNLLGKTVGTSCPVKSQCAQQRCHRVIGVSGKTALRSKGKHNLWAELAYVANQVASDVIAL